MIDRALFVQTYRELWEKKYGEIQRGGDRKSKGQVAPLPNDGFAEHNETGCEGDKVAKGKVYPLPNNGDLNGKMQCLHFGWERAIGST